MKELPEFVKSFIEVRLKKGDIKVITKDVNGTGYSELEFDSEGYTKTLTEKAHIYGYIKRLLKFCKKDIIIYIDDMKLDHIPFMLTYDK
jgi:hypothetical protein